LGRLYPLTGGGGGTGNQCEARQTLVKEKKKAKAPHPKKEWEEKEKDHTKRAKLDQGPRGGRLTKHILEGKKRGRLWGKKGRGTRRMERGKTVSGKGGKSLGQKQTRNKKSKTIRQKLIPQN